MNETLINCPSIESLQQLLGEELVESNARPIRHHVSACSLCQAELDRISGDHELEAWRKARQLISLTGESEGALARVMDWLARSGTIDMSHATTPRESVGEVLAPPLAPLDLGSIGSYRIRTELGRGGMGIVFAAIDTELAREVAIKVMRPDRVHERSRARFVREAQALARVKHPNVAMVHSVVNPAKGVPYFVMDLLQGVTLRARLQAEVRLAPRDAAEIVAAVADGLAEVHAAGLIHRDIKPSNIMLLPEQGQAGGPHRQPHMPPGKPQHAQRPILMDFGLAQIEDDAVQLTQEGMLAGTPSYMSPEQVRVPDQVDCRTDLYSLGVVLYESITGVVPFEGTSQMVLRQVELDEPRAPRQLNDAIPRDLETICLKAMAKEPAGRYQSAAEFADDLRRWLRGEPIRARPANAPERLWRWCRRNPRVAGLTGTVGTLLVAIAVGASVAAGRIAATLETLESERRASLTARVDSLIAAAPDAVPFAIAALRQSPLDARTLLQQKLGDLTDPVEQLHAACGLAEFGEVPTDLIDRIVNAIARVPASTGECANIVSALKHAKEPPLGQLEAAMDQQLDPSMKARFATVLMHLGETRAVETLLALDADPTDRTAWIHSLNSWHGDLADIELVLLRTSNPHARSGLCAALGLLDPQSVTPRVRNLLGQAAAELFSNATDAGTHSAAQWMSNQWQIPLPRTTEMAADWFMNQSGMTMVRVPAGTFTMGDPDPTQDRPQHQVVITKPYFLADREVSVALFEQFLSDAEYSGEKPTREARHAVDMVVSPTDRHPVQNVTWTDAIQFCNWLSYREGRAPCYSRRESSRSNVEPAEGVRERAGWDWNREANGYRLPTEAEWEHACRAGSRTLFHFGDNAELLPHYGVSSNNRVMPARPCGSLIPNGWGLFDMHGNVWEWCWDWFSPFSLEDQVDPAGPAIPEPSIGPYRVYRGGGIANFSGDPVSSARGRAAPVGVGYRNLGFRVACGD